MGLSDWKSTESGLLVPKSANPPVEPPNGEGAVRRAVDVLGSGTRSPAAWNATAAIGQVLAALVAVAAIIVALNSQNEQRLADAREAELNAEQLRNDTQRLVTELKQNADKIAIWSKLSNPVSVTITNRSSVLIYYVDVLAQEYDKGRPKPLRRFRVDNIPPCTRLEATLSGFDGRSTFAAGVHFVESGNAWWRKGELVKSEKTKFQDLSNEGVYKQSLSEISQC